MSSSPQLHSKCLLSTPSLSVHDVLCDGRCRERGAEEHSERTHLVFPYRGVFVRHVGRADTVAQSNHVLSFNTSETYRISHPIAHGDACLSLWLNESVLEELIPPALIGSGSRITLSVPALRIDARAQVMLALLRHGLRQGAAQPLEGQTLALTLVRRALGSNALPTSPTTSGRRKIVDRAKLVLAQDLGRRWTLDEIAAQVGVSPVYLTQLFQLVEGMPLYRYQIRLRLARALDLIDQYADLTQLSLDLGFSSHSHFTAAFRQIYGRTPRDLQRAVRLR